MNENWIKVDNLLEIDDVAERVQEIEQEKEMWKSILDNYVIEYKFEIGENEEKKGYKFCIGKVYVLELWVQESYYQMAKEIVDEVKNAPSINDAWELQNEVPIEEEYEEPEEIVEPKKQEASVNEKTINIYVTVYMVFVVVSVSIMFLVLMAEILKRPTKDIKAIFTLILIFPVGIALLIGITVMLTKKKKEE